MRLPEGRTGRTRSHMTRLEAHSDHGPQNHRVGLAVTQALAHLGSNMAQLESQSGIRHWVTRISANDLSQRETYTWSVSNCPNGRYDSSEKKMGTGPNELQRGVRLTRWEGDRPSHPAEIGRGGIPFYSFQRPWWVKQRDSEPEKATAQRQREQLSHMAEKQRPKLTNTDTNIIPVPAGDTRVCCITPPDSLRGSFPPGQRLNRPRWCCAIYQTSRQTKSNCRF